jgi:hypothetical protein
MKINSSITPTFAFSIPALTLCLIIDLSNSANAEISVKRILPAGVDVSTFSLKEMKSTCR